MKFDNLQVGDVCACNLSRNYVHIDWDRVERVTKTTIVTQKGRRFNKNGIELKSERHCYPCATLWTVESAEAYEGREAAARERRDAVKDLQDALARRSTMRGDYIIGDVELTRIRQLTHLLNDRCSCDETSELCHWCKGQLEEAYGPNAVASPQ